MADDTKTQVSVAMATYNGARYLEAQLESIAGQSELPDEIVISDDNSTDETLEIAKRFGARVPFDVRILPRHERLGFADNFLHAAENCRFPLIMFCDQDDIWVPNKLALSRDRLLQDDSLMLLHKLALVGSDLQPTGVFTQGIEDDATHGPLVLEPYLCGHGNTMMFRQQLVALYPKEKRPLVDGDRLLSHDTWLYTLAAALGSVSLMEASLILYRQHGSNVSSLDERSLRQKLRDLSTFAVRHHERQAAFNGAMASVFSEIASTKAEWSAKASRAATRYRQREAEVCDRLNVYRLPSLRQRLSAFRSVGRRRSQEAGQGKALLLANVKDFVLGVFRTGFRT